MSRTIAEVKRQNKEIGNFWFDPGTMKYFNTVILDDRLYVDRYFLTKERMDDRFPWSFSVRCAHTTGKVETAASGLESATEARRKMRNLARENGYA